MGTRDLVLLGVGVKEGQDVGGEPHGEGLSNRPGPRRSDLGLLRRGRAAVARHLHKNKMAGLGITGYINRCVREQRCQMWMCSGLGKRLDT